MKHPLLSEASFRLGLVLLIVLAFKPVPRIEGLLERVAAPLGILARSTWPLTRWLAKREVQAAETERALEEDQQSRAFVDSLFESALPSAALAAGRRLVPAAVLARSPNDRDRLIVRPWTLSGLEPGQPVVHQDAYVGRLVSVDPSAGVALVELVTGRNFRVGARLFAPSGLRALFPDDPGVALTVGGVAVGRRQAGQEPETWLSAHDPSRARGVLAELPLQGSLAVHEWLPDLDLHAELAEGFDLGRLLPQQNQQDRRVEPLLDFLHGLYHLTILTADSPAFETPVPPPHPLTDPDWVRAEVWASGDPIRWRRTLQLDVGRDRGVVLGAAVVRGARLVGRVRAVFPGACEVALIDDPGCSLPVAASFPDEPERAPQILGRMTALGLDPSTDRPLLHWRDTVPLSVPGLADGEPVRLKLYTGTGEVGLPPGLLIGESYVRTGSSRGKGQRLTLTDVTDQRADPRPVWVRLPSDAERQSLEVGRSP